MAPLSLTMNGIVLTLLLLVSAEGNMAYSQRATVQAVASATIISGESIRFGEPVITMRDNSNRAPQTAELPLARDIRTSGEKSAEVTLVQFY